MADPLDAQAAAFAQLLGVAGNDADTAFRKAYALADGLFPHQVEGVAFLLGRRRAILADDMGLGKTRQAIVSLQHLAPNGPYLVVCPASVKRNWAREIEQVIPDASIVVIDGSAPVDLTHRGTSSPGPPYTLARGGPMPHSARVARSLRSLAARFDSQAGTATWVIVNYDVLGRHRDALEECDWAALVFDEAHYLKNHMSARSKLARGLTDSASTKTPHPLIVQLLTGTPLTSRPRDLFVLLQLVGHPLGRSFLAFAKRYCAAEKGEFGWKTGGASNIDELTVQLHGVMLRRSKDDVLALPPKLRAWVPVTVPATTGARAIKKVLALLTGKSDERLGPVSKATDPRKRGRLLAFLVEARQALAIAKTSATLDFVRGAIEQGEKVIVFSCFDDPIQKLAREFGSSAVVLTGKTPGSTRQTIVDLFQHDDDVGVLLANIIAGGTGLNLTAATQVVFNDLDWVPTNHWQAEDRAYRIGQTRTVNVTYFVAQDTIDDFVHAVLETKAALVAAIVEGEAIAEGAGGDVLDELQRALHSLSSDVAFDGSANDELVGRLVQEASEDFRTRHEVDQRGAVSLRGPTDVEAFRRALERLVRVLSGTPSKRFRIASTSHEGLDYEVVVADADVTCTCPGFEYRGQCRHARDVKAALASGQEVPAPYAEVR
ncbi:MAG TPA: SNF2-related protein [Vicinamibacterales bacterium]|nr:SNF2-related protein [Vicinamibacterales bacterium]